MKKRFLATFVSAVMLATVLTGCGAATQAPAQETAAKEETAETTEVADTQTEEAVPASDDASGEIGRAHV